MRLAGLEICWILHCTSPSGRIPSTASLRIVGKWKVTRPPYFIDSMGRAGPDLGTKLRLSLGGVNPRCRRSYIPVGSGRIGSSKARLTWRIDETLPLGVGVRV